MRCFIFISGPRPAPPTLRMQSFLHRSTSLLRLAPPHESAATYLTAHDPAWDGTAPTPPAPAPKLPPASPATSRAQSWFLHALRESQPSAVPPKDFPDSQNETDQARTAATADHPHAGAQPPSWFASKVGRTIPRLGNMRAPGRAERDVIPAERGPDRGKTSRQTAKLRDQNSHQRRAAPARPPVAWKNSSGRVPALFLLRSPKGLRSDQEP